MKKVDDLLFILGALCFFIYAATKYILLIYLGGLLLVVGLILLIINKIKK